MKKSKEELDRDIAAYLAKGEPTRRQSVGGEQPSRSLLRFKPCFRPCTQEEFDEKFEVLPPIGMTGNGYLVSEPWSHRVCHVTGRYSPTYQAMVKRKGKCFESCEGITVPEWRALDIATLQIV